MDKFDKGDRLKVKTLKGLDEKPSLIEEVADEKVLEAIPTFRRMLRIIAGNSQPKPGTEESIDLVQIGLKLKVEGDVSLEDAEFKLLLAKAKDNRPDYSSQILGQILLKFKDAEKEADKK